MTVANNLARKYDTDAQPANQPVFDADLEPAFSLRITVALKSASVLNITEDDGTTTQTYALNSGNELGGDELYTFDVPIRSTSTYNVELETSVGIRVLNVDTVRNSEV